MACVSFSVFCNPLCFLRYSIKSALTDISSGLLGCWKVKSFFCFMLLSRWWVLHIQKANLFSIHFLVKHLQTWIFHISKHSHWCPKWKFPLYFFSIYRPKKEPQSLTWCEINFLLCIEACFPCTKITSSLFLGLSVFLMRYMVLLEGVLSPYLGNFNRLLKFLLKPILCFPFEYLLTTIPLSQSLC